MIDALPNAEGVVYPDRDVPTLPPDARCQETTTMINDRYVRCGEPASAVIWHEKDGRAYWMCDGCAWHNERNRGGKRLI